MRKREEFEVDLNWKEWNEGSYVFSRFLKDVGIIQWSLEKKRYFISYEDGHSGLMNMVEMNDYFESGVLVLLREPSQPVHWQHFFSRDFKPVLTDE